MKRAAWILPLVLLLLAGMLSGEDPEGPEERTNPPYPAPLKMLSDEFMLSFYRFAPSAATRAGIRDKYDFKYDSQIMDLSRDHIMRQVEDYKRLEKRFELLNPARWSQIAAADRAMMIARANAAIFELETIRWWENDPARYSCIVADSALVLSSRNFATAPERLGYLVARERKMPQVFQAARENLKDPPRVYTEIAIEQLPGIISYFHKDVPALFSQVADPKLMADFRQSNAGVVKALEDYLAWLKHDLLPRSTGDFRLGAENYRKKLLYEEMVDLPLDRLLKIGYEDLGRNQQEFARVAALINPNKPPRQVLAELEAQHPAPDKLLDAFRSHLPGLRAFLDEKHVINTPSNQLPIVEEMPPFPQSLTPVSLDTPGPFERDAREAFLNIMLPSKSWSRRRVREYMLGFNDAAINSMAMYEVLPGRFEQSLWTSRVHSKVRQFLSLDPGPAGERFSATNVGGWAHYTEQMMLEEGFGRTAGVSEAKDTNFLRLRLGELQNALLLDARLIAGLEMHTRAMTLDEAEALFAEQAYQTRSSAHRETLLVAVAPTLFTDTVGKLEILKLREDYRDKLGAKFNLLDFHDRFMEQGVAPLSLIRQAMLGDTDHKEGAFIPNH